MDSNTNKFIVLFIIIKHKGQLFSRYFLILAAHKPESDSFFIILEVYDL